MRTKSPTTVRILLGTATAAAALLVTAACGGGSNGNMSSGGNGAAPAGAASGAAAGAGASANAGMDAPSASDGAMAGGGAPTSVTIAETKSGGMDHYAFNPTSANVTDDQITIVNKSDEIQKVTCTGGPAAASATIAAGKTGVMKFHGDGKYSCSTNKGAKITIDVA